MEMEREVRIIEVDMKCNECGGTMRWSKKEGVLASNPVQYTHICQSCGHKENYIKKYPYFKGTVIPMSDWKRTI